MKPQHVLKGLLSYVPGMLEVLPQTGTGGSDSARYCYGVWLKHLTMLRQHGLDSLPNVIAELGPGDSIGTGLAAMLSGVDKYCALDIVSFSNQPRNLRIFDELVDIFRSREGRPIKGWPDFDTYLDSNLFPSHILDNEVLQESLSQPRIAEIRDAILDSERRNSSVTIKYMAPWSDPGVIESGSVDVIFSHSVLEHVEDLASTYRALASWLKPGGLMSHQIDFTSHGLSEEWNGYRAHSEVFWNLARGKRPFFINRQPCSKHIELLQKNGFQLTCQLKEHRDDGIRRQRLARRWQDLSEDDLTCAGLFVQARKVQ